MSTILVTGANRGIGFEFVKQYLEKGDSVVATYRDEESSKELINLSLNKSNLKVLKLDVASDESMKDFCKNLSIEPIDIFINNAGVYGPCLLYTSPSPRDRG